MELFSRVSDVSVTLRAPPTSILHRGLACLRFIISHNSIWQLSGLVQDEATVVAYQLQHGLAGYVVEGFSDESAV